MLKSKKARLGLAFMDYIELDMDRIKLVVGGRGGIRTRVRLLA